MANKVHKTSYVRDTTRAKKKIAQMDVTITTTSAHAHALQVDEKERPPLQTPDVRRHELDRGAHQTLDAAWGGKERTVQMSTRGHVVHTRTSHTHTHKDMLAAAPSAL